MNTYTMICVCDSGDNMIMFYVDAPNVDAAIERLRAHVKHQGERFALFSDLSDDNATNDEFWRGATYALAYVFEGRLRDVLTPEGERSAMFIDVDNNERA